MKLRRMQVKNFRCIEDSTEFTVCPVTAFVGKNGAGKTSLLEALYKLNPDVEELGRFDVLMEYPRARRREYQRQADREPDDVLITTWELEDQDVQKVEEAFGPGTVRSRTVIARKGYYAGRKWAGEIAEQGVLRSDSQQTQDATNGPGDAHHVFEKHVAPLLPKLLYFSEWHIMQGRISIDALLQRRQRGELTGPDRVFLALLALGGTSVEALTSIERSEELIADLEDAARPVTAEVARYWSQERDLRVSFHLYPARPGDPAPLDRGLVFETRIVNLRTDLSLNFEERSTGFVWFFSFLVWYSDVRKRYGDNLIILLDDPGLGLHANAQWDLLRYIGEKLAPRYQVAYATHSPFMIDPDKLPWVRTVEEVSEPTRDGRLNYLGTKVGDEVLSTDHDTLLPLQASLGYRIIRDLAGDKRLLLVDKPSDMLYLQWFSSRLNERGRAGLHGAWSIVPCGDLVRLATLASLLTGGASGCAVLLGLPAKHPDVTARREINRVLETCRIFALPAYAQPSQCTVEDLIGPQMYMALVDLCYKLPRKQRLSRTIEPIADEPVLKIVANAFAEGQRASANFDPALPAECLFKGKTTKMAKLPGFSEALTRFETLFAAINAAL